MMIQMKIGHMAESSRWCNLPDSTVTLHPTILMTQQRSRGRDDDLGNNQDHRDDQDNRDDHDQHSDAVPDYFDDT